MLEFGLYLSKYNESDDIVHLSLGVKLLGKYNEVEKSSANFHQKKIMLNRFLKISSHMLKINSNIPRNYEFMRQMTCCNDIR